jgi:hypothetical protein
VGSREKKFSLFQVIAAHGVSCKSPSFPLLLCAAVAHGGNPQDRAALPLRLCVRQKTIYARGLLVISPHLPISPSPQSPIPSPSVRNIQKIQ